MASMASMRSRTVAIQSALIREHYLTGEPTGVWDEASKDAMLRYQAANGWQTKITPDSRALIKLGLGPDHKGLLNPGDGEHPVAP
jgi:peptidoglycan hydrolase-like protein with peptidoglycan-binding domain